MITFLYIILIVTGIPLWLWLASRISHVTHIGALLGLFLVLPAFYWVYKLWDDRRAQVRVPAIANLLVNLIALPALVFFSGHYALSQARAAAMPKPNPYMDRWCREQNDAVYDPVLQVCVEPSKAEVLVQEQHDNVIGQFGQYLQKRGMDGELNRSATPETATLKNLPEIADAAGYSLSPATSSPTTPLLIALCVSESACARLAARDNRNGPNVALAKGHLLLVIAPDSVDAARLSKLKAIMGAFRPD
jgi:hypothetical protein